MEKNNPIAKMGIDAQTLIKHLMPVPVGGLVTYTELAAVIGRSVRKGGGQTALYTAMRYCRREHRKLFVCVRNEGYKVANSAECINEGQREVVRVRRSANRGQKKVACADYDSLDREEQVRHNTALAQLGVLKRLTLAPQTKRLAAAVEKAGRLPTIEAVTAMFSTRQTTESTEGDTQ